MSKFRGPFIELRVYIPCDEGLSGLRESRIYQAILKDAIDLERQQVKLKEVKANGTK